MASRNVFDLEVYVSILSSERWKRIDHKLTAKVGDYGYSDHAFDSRLVFSDLQDLPLCERYRLTGDAEHSLALRCEVDVSTLSMQQSDPQVLLQQPQRLAHRRLSAEEPSSCSRDAPFFDHDEERPQLVEVH